MQNIHKTTHDGPSTGVRWPIHRSRGSGTKGVLERRRPKNTGNNRGTFFSNIPNYFFFGILIAVLHSKISHERFYCIFLTFMGCGSSKEVITETDTTTNNTASSPANPSPRPTEVKAINKSETRKSETSIISARESIKKSNKSNTNTNTNETVMSKVETLKSIVNQLNETEIKSASELIPILQNILDRLKDGASGGGASGGLPRSIKGYDEYTASKLDPFVAAGIKLGGDAATGAALIKEAWTEMRSYLLTTTACKEPAQPDLVTLFTPISEKVRAITAATNRNEWENHLKTLSEGAGALNWLLVKPAPVDFIESFVGGSDFWGNKIRKEYRTTNPDQMAFVDTFKALLLGLMAYVKEYHTTGISWNSKGISTSEYKEGGGASAAAAPAVAATATTTTTTAAPKAAIELKPDGATAGLKKVTKEQQTWRAEYNAGDAPAPLPAVPKKAPAAAAPQVKGPPKLE